MFHKYTNIALWAALVCASVASCSLAPDTKPVASVACDDIRVYDLAQEKQLAAAFLALKKLPDSSSLKPLEWVVDEDTLLRSRSAACAGTR